MLRSEVVRTRRRNFCARPTLPAEPGHWHLVARAAASSAWCLEFRKKFKMSHCRGSK